MGLVGLANIALASFRIWSGLDGLALVCLGFGWLGFGLFWAWLGLAALALVCLGLGFGGVACRICPSSGGGSSGSFCGPTIAILRRLDLVSGVW